MVIPFYSSPIYGHADLKEKYDINELIYGAQTYL
jgi:hypothetical protein